MAPSVISDDMHDPEFRRLLAQEELILEVTEVLCGLLEAETISKKELANRLGKSKGFVSQLLNGGRNLTLRTVADILHVLGYKVSLTPYKQARQRQESNVIEFKTRQSLNKKKPIQTWGPLEISFPENYSDIISAISG
ncbi:MAG: helix-turn-helix domain-containing protein [Desulfobaccales bacterium]